MQEVPGESSRERPRADVLKIIDELWKDSELALRSDIAHLARGLVDADELYNETWLRVRMAFERYDRQRSFRLWVLGIARNVQCELYRKQSERTRNSPRHRIIQLDPQALAALEDASITLFAESESDLQDAFRTCLSELREKNQLAYDLLRDYYDKKLTRRDLRDSAAVTNAALRQRVCRWREMLRRCVDDRMTADKDRRSR